MPNANNPYFTSKVITLKDGRQVDEDIINGPPQPPAGYERPAVTLPKSNPALGVVTLTIPAYEWSFGCSATSGSMIAAYYDRNGYPNIYTGPTNGGVMPLDSSPWPNWNDGSGHPAWAQCPLTASHNGLDGRTTRGSIDDYWVAYDSTAPDPYITNDWTQHAWGDAIGDYMKTSQSAYGFTDGGTGFVYYTNGTPLTCDDIAKNGWTSDGDAYGRELFYEARGYTVTDCYNQLTDNQVSGGFSFAQYKAEIDAGRPVMLQLVGHTIVGVGYDSSTNTVYLHDTWDYLTHTMTWGGSYGNSNPPMNLVAVSIVNLASPTPTLYYVKPGGTGNCTSWANACTLQTALTGAASGSEIWVAAGTYKPTTGTDRTATFQLKNGVAVYGGFAGTETARSLRDPATNVTILSGDLNRDDVGFSNNSENVYHVVTGANGATLDGFTISGGNADGSATNDRGAGIYDQDSNPTLTNITFSYNSAVFGGGMFNDTSGPVLTNVIFSGNLATADGGGMYSSSGSPTLTNVNFTNNSAPYGGGMVNDNSDPTLMGVAFSTNTATSNGGGMLDGGTNGSNPKLMDVTFSSNTATGIGGGVFNSSSSPMLIGDTFSGNSASSGGGMYNSSSNPTLTNVNFTGNSATDGGGMDNDSSNPILAGGTYNGNTATDQGGGMYNTGSSPTLTNLTFSNNTAYVAGGLYNSSSNPKLTNVTFSENSASSGGGIFNSLSSPTLANVTFSGNSALSTGGGIYNAGSPALTDVTFSANTASSGGGIYNYSGSPKIINTIFWGNTATANGPQIYNNSGTTILSYSVLQGGCPAGSTCTNIITADPLLGSLGAYGGLTQTISLQAGSSAVDTGNDSICAASPVNNLDQRGVKRPQGTHCDIGAFELVQYTISGNAGDAGVVLHYTNVTALTVTSASNGRYSFTVPSGWSGTVTPTKTGVTFKPAGIPYNSLITNQTNQNYADIVNIASTASYDGWILESAKGTGKGGTMNSTATTFHLGDDNLNRQYRSILSFNTAPLPDTAVIQSAVLKIKQSGLPVGINPFTVLGTLYTDIRKGYFGTSPALELADFNALATASKIGSFGATPVSGWYSSTLNATGKSDINKTSLTQLRLYFATPTNNNSSANYMSFFSGNAAAGNQPLLVITYSLP
jgi:predicted outer membrane repeat protein